MFCNKSLDLGGCRWFCLGWKLDEILYNIWLIIDSYINEYLGMKRKKKDGFRYDGKSFL